MGVELPREHHCRWREHAERLERELGGLIAQQQELLERQREVIAQLEERQRDKDVEMAAKIRRLEVEVARLERQLFGRKSEKIKIPPAERELEPDEELTEEQLARRAQETANKRRERALARSASMSSDT